MRPHPASADVEPAGTSTLRRTKRRARPTSDNSVTSDSCVLRSAVIRLGPVLMLLGLVVAMTLLSPVFLTTGNAGNVLAQTAAIAVLAIGQLLVILTRGIDLSVGSTLALASVVGAHRLLARQLGGSS